MDAVAQDYSPDDIVFLAVAGKSSPEKSAQRAAELFGERITWGYDDAVWEPFGSPYQPYTILITGGDVIVEEWYGPRDADSLRAAVDHLLSVG